MTEGASKVTEGPSLLERNFKAMAMEKLRMEKIMSRLYAVGHHHHPHYHHPSPPPPSLPPPLTTTTLTTTTPHHHHLPPPYYYRPHWHQTLATTQAVEVVCICKMSLPLSLSYRFFVLYFSLTPGSIYSPLFFPLPPSLPLLPIPSLWLP